MPRLDVAFTSQAVCAFTLRFVFTGKRIVLIGRSGESYFLSIHGVGFYKIGVPAGSGASICSI